MIISDFSEMKVEAFAAANFMLQGGLQNHSIAQFYKLDAILNRESRDHRLGSHNEKNLR